MPLSIGPGLLTLRENLLIRILRGLQFILAVVVLAVSASNISNWHELYCSTPGKLAYNIAASLITILILIYIIASTGKQRLTFIPWHHFIQLGLDCFLLILWIASTATATLTCNDVCKSCSGAGTYYDAGCGFYVWYGGQDCYCSFGYDTGYCPFDKHKRAILDAQNVFEKRASGHAGVGGTAFKGLKNGSKLGPNVVELLLFVVSIAATIYFIFMARRQDQSTAPHGNPTAASTQQVVEEPKTEQPQPVSYLVQNAAGPPQQTQQSAHYPPQSTHYESQQQAQPVSNATYNTGTEITQPMSTIDYGNDASNNYQHHHHYHQNEQNTSTQYVTTQTHDSSSQPPSYNTSPPADYTSSTTY